MGVRAIRQQISAALDLVVQVSRFSDGTRRVTHITEVTGMEVETITLQTFSVREGRRGGRRTGDRTFPRDRHRPRAYERIKACGIQLPTSLFQTVVEIN